MCKTHYILYTQTDRGQVPKIETSTSLEPLKTNGAWLEHINNTLMAWRKDHPIDRQAEDNPPDNGEEQDADDTGTGDDSDWSDGDWEDAE